MIFYDCSTAPSPRRARILLSEKNVPHTTINIDLAKGEQLSPEFRLINPSCTVPVLKLDDGVILTQNAGIAAYLEAEYPDPPLLGRTSSEKGEIASWNAKIEYDGLYPIAEALRNSSPYMENRAITGGTNYAQIPELAERGHARVVAFFDMMEEHLEGRDYVVTDDFSVADITAAVAVDFARVVKIKPQDHQTNLIRWRSRLAERPSMSL